MIFFGKKRESGGNVVLERCFGDWLCFEGGVSVQTTLPFGTLEDVQAEVEHLIGTLGKGGGYILGPFGC